MKKNNIFSVFIKFLLQGILIIAPVTITIWSIFMVFKSIDSLIPKLSDQFPGLVFAIIVFGTALIGFLGSKFVIGKLLVSALDYILEHSPGVKLLYSPIKEFVSSFLGDKRKFTNPVLVKVQNEPEIWRAGFITQEDMTSVGLDEMISVYLPHSYAISGWVIITNRENIKKIDAISAKKAMEFAVSGGTINLK